MKLFWPVVLVLTVATVSSGPARAASSGPAPEAQCAVPLEPGRWTRQEVWAWNDRLCVGQGVVDFSKIQACGTVLSSVFVRRLLTYRPMKDVLDVHSMNSIELKCASMKDQLDLEDVRSDMGIRFEKVVFYNGIQAKRSAIRRFTLFDSIVAKDFDAVSMRIDDELSFGRSKFHGDVLLDRTNITGDLIISDSTVDGKISMIDSNTNGSVSLQSLTSVKERCEIHRNRKKKDNVVALNLWGANISGKLELVNCVIHGDILGIGAYVGGELVIEGYSDSDRAVVKGKIDLERARISRKVDLDYVDIDGIRANRSAIYRFRIMDSIVHKDVEVSATKVDGDLYVENSTFHGDVVLNRTSVAGTLGINDSIVDGTIDMAFANVDGSVEINGKVYSEDKRGEIRNSKGAKIALHLAEAKISERLQLLNVDIHGDIRGTGAYIGGSLLSGGASIKGDVNLTRTRVAETVRLVEGVDIEGDIYAFRSVIHGDLAVLEGTRMRGLRGYEIEVGRDIDLHGSEWETVILAGATVGQKLKLWYDCAAAKGRKKLVLRDARVSGIDDLMSDGYEAEQENVDCMWKNIDADFSGWEYDEGSMAEVLEHRDVEWLVEWIARGTPACEGDAESGDCAGRHRPLPYIYLAERLEELGLVDKANGIRIRERELNLQSLSGIEGAWQWVIGATTRFGYAPGFALVWLAFLVVIGMVLIRLAGSTYGTRIREKNKVRYRWRVAFFVVLTAVLAYGVFARWWWWASMVLGSLAVGLVTFAALAWGARGLALRNAGTDEDAGVGPPGAAGDVRAGHGSIWKSALLYSIDRTVPFLGFDGEHIGWFDQRHQQRLNDIPVLCVYFYVHSILGFAFTSLFVAGLTGVLK